MLHILDSSNLVSALQTWTYKLKECCSSWLGYQHPHDLSRGQALPHALEDCAICILFQHIAHRPRSTSVTCSMWRAAPHAYACTAQL